jgi:hypothetical protein
MTESDRVTWGNEMEGKQNGIKKINRSSECEDAEGRDSLRTISAQIRIFIKHGMATLKTTPLSSTNGARSEPTVSTQPENASNEM